MVHRSRSDWLGVRAHEGLVMLRTPLVALMAMVLVAVSAIPCTAQTLEGIAILPADTFQPGPSSGQFIAAANGRIPPFLNQQPVQGVSSVLRAKNGDFLVMSDNGYGARNNSADYVLRVPSHHAGLQNAGRRHRDERRKIVHHAPGSRPSHQLCDRGRFSDVPGQPD
jgi:hypothetical protein